MKFRIAAFLLSILFFPLRAEVDQRLHQSGSSSSPTGRPIISGTPITPDISPYDGHDVAGSYQNYNVLRANCHTATNSCIDNDRKVTGALICSGKPENQGWPADHTACWRVKNGETCIWNWGFKKCFLGEQMPPDIKQEDAKKAADWVCFNRCRGECKEIRFLPAGQKVEIPGSAACIREIKEKQKKSSKSMFRSILNWRPAFVLEEACKDCCSRRRKMWNKTPDKPSELVGESFEKECTLLCTGYFSF